jgi:hypothetical protein
MNLVIKILSSERRGAVFGYEISDKSWRRDTGPTTFPYAQVRDGRSSLPTATEFPASEFDDLLSLHFAEQVLILLTLYAG